MGTANKGRDLIFILDSSTPWMTFQAAERQLFDHAQLADYHIWKNGKICKIFKLLGYTELALESMYEKFAGFALPSRMSNSPQVSMQVFEIPGLVEARHNINALGDTCAKSNFMRAAYAEHLGLTVDNESGSSVVIGNGKKLSTMGTVEARFQFQNEPEVYSLVFHLVPNCIHDLILGKAFLKATRTFTSLTNQNRRVVKRTIEGVAQRQLLYLGDSAMKFTGLLNSRKQQALADMGSRVLVMDEAYAQSVGLPITTGTEHLTKLRFADGSTAMTSGMTFGVKWEFGTDGDSEQYILDFHILKDAPAPVILNGEFLFNTNAFSEFECYLVDEHDEDEDAYFFVIDIDTNYHHQVDLEQPECSEYHTELVRRGEEDDRIADLPFTQQAEALSVEMQRRQQWDTRRNSQSQPPFPSNSTILNDASPQANSSCSPAPTKRSRWRFKLKRKKTSG